MKKKIPLKIPDVIIILLSLGLTGFSAHSAYLKPRNTAQVMIQSQTQTWLFPLDAEETINVPGPLGTTVVRIHDNQAWVEYSPCENKTCVACGHIWAQGAWVACLPNNVFLLIEGSDGYSDLPDSIVW
jgi:hypothetical protein